ncbi:MAG TPA: FtsQ-type POTRA domain-containing protein, partial [Gemmatimonadales bacterium]|nr:FtsQ-type POTRA domain-containing protein [Gemmatimonadales bacterium]
MRAALALAVVAAGLALAGRARPAAAQEPSGLAGRADSIAVEGNRRITRATIIAAAAIPLRTPIGFRDVQRAVHALYDSEQFDSVSVLRSVGPDSAEIIVIRVTERPLLTRVTV